jgi:hypothetical protein
MIDRAAHQTPGLAAAPRYGVIDSYDSNTYRVKVILAPSADGKTPLTGNHPLCSPWVGNGWGIVCPPMPGDQHVLMHAQNNPDQPIAVGRFFDKNHLPPKRQDGMAALGGEFILRHSSGSCLEFRNDQKVLINGQVELDLTTMKLTMTATTEVDIVTPLLNIGGASGGDCTINLTGTIVATGEITAKSSHTVSAHTHPDPQGGNTATPTG